MTNTSWSYSSYSTAIKCLNLYDYIYIKGLVSEEPESGDLAFGSALHMALAASITGKDELKAFEGYWGSYEGIEIAYGRFKWAELGSLGTEFLRKFKKKYANDFKSTISEKRIYGEYNGVKLEGTPDFIGNFKDKTTLIDFKTSGYNYLPEKKDCALQLYLYAYLVKQNYGFYPEQLGYFVFNKGTGTIQAPMMFPFNEDKMKRALDSMVSFCSMLDERKPWGIHNYNSCIQGSIVCPFYKKCFHD